MSFTQIIYTDFTYIDYDTDVFVYNLTENLLSQVKKKSGDKNEGILWMVRYWIGLKKK